MTRRRLLSLASAAFGLAGTAFVAQAAYLPAKAALAQHKLEQAWIKARTDGVAARPWSWADAKVFAEIRAPDHGARAIVLSDASGEAMAFAPGHLSHTPQPGEPGVEVIAAHRDTHFRFLKDVRPGDRIEVETADGETPFEVVGAEVVRWDASGIDPRAPGRRLALVTCYPFDALESGGPLRYVVWAEAIEAGA